MMQSEEQKMSGVTMSTMAPIEVSRQMLIWRVADDHPFHVVMAFPSYLQVVDARDQGELLQTYVILQRDYDRFVCDVDLDCKITKIYDNYFKDFELRYVRL